jgi:hypothetical protein
MLADVTSQFLFVINIYWYANGLPSYPTHLTKSNDYHKVPLNKVLHFIILWNYWRSEPLTGDAPQIENSHGERDVNQIMLLPSSRKLNINFL